MSNELKSNNLMLVEAVMEGDIVLVNKLLDGGANPNFKVNSSDSSLTATNLALKLSEFKIVELLRDRGGIVGRNLISDLSEGEATVRDAKELLVGTEDVKVFGEIFLDLVYNYEGPAALGMLQFLLDRGLPVDEYIEFSTPLQYSVAAGKIDFVTRLLQRGADIRKLTKKAESCLWLAVKMSNIRMVKLLLKKGVNVNEKITSESGRTALHKACEDSQNSELIHLLLDYDADMSALDDGEHPPLAYTACEAGDPGTEIFLKELALMKFEGREISSGNRTCIFGKNLQKIFNGCTEELEKLKGVKVYGDLTLLHILRIKRRSEQLQIYAKNEEFVDKFKTYWGRREVYKYYDDDLRNFFCTLKKFELKSVNALLIKAVEEGNLISVQELLVEFGVDPNHKYNNTTVVNLALQHHERKIVEVLVERGGVVGRGLISNDCTVESIENLLDTNGNPDIMDEIFLEMVYKCEGPEAAKMLEYLLDNGLPIDEDIESSAPIHYCVAAGKLNLVNLLIRRGADIDMLTTRGESCLWLAVKTSNVQLVELLLKYGVAINERISSDGGATALHKACEGSHNAEIIKLLLDYDADLSIMDKDGHTPLMSSVGEAGDSAQILLKELALMEFEARYISAENLDCINSLETNRKDLWIIFSRCIEELENMEHIMVCEELTLLDILQMKKLTGELVVFAKNPEFVEQFCSDRQLCYYYGEDLGKIASALKERILHEKSSNESLVEAVKKSDIKSVDELLCEGADPNYKPEPSHLNPTVVNLALKCGEFKMVELLVERGGIVGHGLILDVFTFELSFYNVKHLLNSRENVNLLKEIFLELLYHHDGPEALGMFNVLLDRGLSLDEYINDYTPLHYSVANGNVEFIRLMLERGADVRQLTKNHQSSLWLAVKLGKDSQVIEPLLEAGADVNERISPEEGMHFLRMPIIFYAAHANQPETVRLLRNYGAQIHPRSVSACIPDVPMPNAKYILRHLLHIGDYELEALKLMVYRVLRYYDGNDAAESLEIFLDDGLPVDTLLGVYTLLHRSVDFGKTELVKVLLDRGADINRLSRFKNQSCLVIAANNNNLQMVTLLLRRGARVNQLCNPTYQTLLHAVSEKAYEPRLVKTLLEYGASFDIRDCEENVPLEGSEDASTEGDVYYSLVKGMAKRAHDGQTPSRENLDCLKRYNLIEIYDECIVEFKVMKQIIIYKNLSLLDILNLDKCKKKLHTFVKNRNFIKNFKTGWVVETFKYFGSDLVDTFESAMKRKYVLEAFQKDLTCIFRGILPDLILQKVAYFVNEDLFFPYD